MSRVDLRSLSDAMRGKPSEADAVKVIATFATIPAAVVGIVLGFLLLPRTAGPGSLFAYPGIGAAAAALLVLLAIHGAYRSFGFGAVAWVAGALLGGIIGLGAHGLLMQHGDWQAGRWWVPTLAGAVLGAASGYVGRRNS